MEKTLIVLKPDAVQRAIVGEIISRFEKVGLKIVATKMLVAEDIPGSIGKMKQFASWFTHGVRNGSELRRQVQSASSPHEVLERVNEFFSAPVAR